MDADMQDRLRLLALIDATPLRNTFGPGPNNDTADLYVMRDMINDGWLEGSAFPPDATFIENVLVIAITAAGRRAMKAGKPVSRFRRFFAKHLTLTISILMLIVTAIGVFLTWRVSQSQASQRASESARHAIPVAAPSPTSTVPPIATPKPRLVS